MSESTITTVSGFTHTPLVAQDRDLYVGILTHLHRSVPKEKRVLTCILDSGMNQTISLLTHLHTQHIKPSNSLSQIIHIVTTTNNLDFLHFTFLF